MTDLTAEAIRAVDPQDMLGDVLAQPGQLEDALWRADAAGLGEYDVPGGLVVCGMGGSAIGADLAAAALGDRATRPIRVIRTYELDPWAGPDSLVLCCSYSGNTEETLACFEAAGATGAARVALTTGGELAAAAREAGVPVIGVPSGMQPRAAVIYMTIGVLVVAAAAGAAPQLRSEIDSLAQPLGARASEWGPDAPEDSLAKSLARDLQGTVPVVYGAGATVAVARRWKAQLNENAEAPAFASELPEADHNEICAWRRAEAPFSAVFLEDSDQHPRLSRRFELTAEVIGATGATAKRVDAPTAPRLERVLSLVLLGDLVSVYLAVLEGVDPTPVEVLDRFKADL